MSLSEPFSIGPERLVIAVTVLPTPLSALEISKIVTAHALMDDVYIGSKNPTELSE